MKLGNFLHLPPYSLFVLNYLRDKRIYVRTTYCYAIGTQATAGKMLLRLCLFIGIACTTAGTSGGNQCPPNCRCVAGDTVICVFQNPTDYKAFADLSDKTISLTGTVTGSFKEDLVDFSQLNMLENLTLEADRNYSSYQEAAHEGALATFRRRELFQNLTNLRSLSIRLVITSFHSALLAPLRHLKALSFSSTYMFNFNDFVDIVKETGSSLKHLEDFRMIAVQRLITPHTFIKMKDHVYENLQNLSLKVLDLTMNKAVLFQYGLSSYLPRLEVFRVGASELIFESTNYSITCNMAEVLMHASLREFELSFPKTTPRGVWESTDRFLYCIQRLHASSDLCDLANCICEGLTQIPCQPYGKKIHIKDLIQRPSYKGEPWTICIPPPPSMETVVFRNYPSVVIDHNGHYCFNPSNMSNRITNIDLSFDDLKYELSPQIRITGLKQLRFLNLQRNGIIISGETKMFSDMPLLEVLLLGGNNLSTISRGDLDFLHIQNLKVLNLENCGIHQIPLNSLENLMQLKVLNLSNNMLSEFEANIGNLKQLKLLDLSRNQITTLRKEITDQLDAQADVGGTLVLDLSRNPLTCFCDNIGFVQWLKTTRVQFAQRNVTTCIHPTMPVVSPWLVDVNDLYRECIHFNAIISSTISAAGMAFLLIVIYVVYRIRWRFRYWIYHVKASIRQRRYQGEYQPLLTHEYRYDAFVAYSSRGQERRWVHTTLREKLENEHGLKLCLHHRNFKAGRDLADTIIEGINSSNKTVLILSPDFLRSGWCEFEARMASEKVISERRDSVILVMFKQVDHPGSRLPKMLARLLEKKDYIKWTSDDYGERLFWRKLVDSIRSRASYDTFNELYHVFRNLV